MEKARKKKKDKPKNTAITPLGGDKTVSKQNLLDEQEAVGSVISVKEAATTDKKDYTNENGYSNDALEVTDASDGLSQGPSSSSLDRPNSPAQSVSSRPTSARPSSARPTSARPVSSRPTSARPTSARPSTSGQRSNSAASATNGHPSTSAQQPSGDIPGAVDPNIKGSVASLKSREVWTGDTPRAQSAVSLRSNKEKNEIPASVSVGKNKIAPAFIKADSHSQRSTQDELSVSSVLGPAELNASHAYVPYLYARDCISRIMADMKKMKAYHLSIVHDIDNNYKAIEQQTQNQFNLFVLSLRDQYGKKVKTFRQVIEVHRVELQQKQQYWDEVLASFASRNQKLLVDKKTLLIQNKLEIDRLEKEKEEVVDSLTVQLDNQTKAMKELKNEQSSENEEFEKQLKVLIEKLDKEKEEKRQLEEELEELKNRVTSPVVGAAVLSTEQREETDVDKEKALLVAAAVVSDEKDPVTKSSKIKNAKRGEKAPVNAQATSERPSSSRPPTRQPTVIIKDMSEDEREKMDEEREMMEAERVKMQEEREAFERERGEFVEERKRFQEERVVLQGDINTCNKDKETWKAKYEGLKDQLGDVAELRAKYQALEAQLAATAAMAVVSSDEDRKKADDKIEKAGADKTIMEEEQVSLKQDLQKWEENFEKENGRKATEEEKPDSVKELETSLGESQAMIDKLNAQINALETLKKGEVPQPPPVPVTPITIKETEVKIVEIKVPDPEIVAHLEMTQAELEATRTQLLAMKKIKGQMQSQISNLQGEVDDLKWQLEKAAAAQEELEKQLNDAQDEIDDLKAQLANQVPAAAVQSNADDQDRIAELERLLKEKERELEAQNIVHREAMEQVKVEHLKEKHDMERDIKKLLKEIAKLKKKLKDKPEEEKQPEDQQLEKAEDRADDLENTILDLEAKISNLEADNNAANNTNTDLKQRVVVLEAELKEAEVKVAALNLAAGAEAALADSQNQVEDLREKVKELEALVRDLEQELRDAQRDHEKALNEKDKVIKEMENDMRKLLKQMDKLRKKLAAAEAKASDGDTPADTETVDTSGLKDKISDLEDEVSNLETDKEHLKETNADLEKRIEELSANLAAAEDQAAVLAVAAAAENDLERAEHDLDELRRRIRELEEQVRDKENEVRTKERELQQKDEELQQKERDFEQNLREKDKLIAEMEKDMKKLLREIAKLRKKLAQVKGDVSIPESNNDEVDRLEKEIEKLESKMTDQEKQLIDIRGDRDTAQKENKSKSDQVNKLTKERDRLDAELKEERAAHEITRQELETFRRQVAALKAEVKAAGVKGKDAAPAVVAAAAAARSARADRGRGAPSNDKALKDLQDKLREAKSENRELQTRIKQLEAELRQGGKGGGGDGEASRMLKKQEKLVKELEKLLDGERKKNKKNEDNLKQQQEDNKQLYKDIKEKDAEISRLKGELSALGLAAKEGLESAKKVKALEKDVKKLQEENKTLSENYNTERVLRKKYYNMVEDMKGKIRVYCRVRPMSKSELNRGNVDAVKSPDEYSVNVTTQRGLKEFQFDTVFMPDSTQEKVFEDTNNLIQSAVDGYNVCIFAYGQTGSGKTFTIIGDSQGNHPGIAPRAFEKIFSLLDENKSKFSYKVSCYMLELYNDQLIDLFVKGGHTDDEKLEIKKDKKGMVMVQGAEVKKARNAKELFGLFEEGSKTRHTASTKMNSESSRSHLVIGIVIETTNRTTGQVIKGKLSLVDLAGSERAAKTDASAEQLKEAMSINKSLSALGDVISALSSEQSFIPYRNNKLTMLMQDSLGGNAKTLMFVNISPADYNSDESAISLTYASRVKLITNDAQKNLDNKEIARLKSIINKMKKGEGAIEEED